MSLRRFSLGTMLTRMQRAQNLGRCRRQAVALWVLLALLSVPMVVFASPTTTAKASTGLIMTDGSVMLNGARAISGETLFSRSSITTDERSHSVVQLPSSARLKLDAQTSLSMTFSDSSLFGSLDKGAMNSFSPAGFRSELVTTDSTIISDAGQQSNFRIQVEECNTTLSVETGRVEIRTGDKVRFVSAGESFSTAENSVRVPAMSHRRKNIVLIVIFVAAAGIITAVLLTRCTKVTSPTGSTGQCS